MKHTPGPWRTGKTGGTVVADASEGITVNGAYNEDAKEYYGGNLIGESISPANVKLIAAAPDLLNACLKLIDAPHQEHFATRLNDEEMEGIEMIKAAIQKAKG